MKGALSRDRLFVILILLTGLVYRLDFLFQSNFRIDSDEAIVGLMAKHITEGGSIPTFYYGQHYMGSLEALIAAVLFKAFGISVVSLKLVPLLFSLLFVWLVYHLTVEIADKVAARFAMTLAAVAPATFAVWSAKARGGFIEVMVLGAWALLLTCRWLKEEEVHFKPIVGIGFIVGIGWWVNNQIVYFMPPIGIFVAFHLFRRFGLLSLVKGFVLGMGGFLAGGSPYWIYNLKNHFISFSMFGSASGEEMGEHLVGVFASALPILLGARRFWHTEDVFSGASAIVAIIYLAALLFLLWNRRAWIAKLFCFKLESARPVEILLILLVSAIAIFVLSSFGWLVTAPRYLLPIYVAIFPLLGVVLSLLYFGFGRSVAYVLFSILLLINLMSSYWREMAIPGEPFVHSEYRAAKDHTELVGWLDANGYSWVRTNYWIGYRLAFETKERIKFKVFGAPYQSRIKSYEQEAELLGEDTFPLVLVPSQVWGVRQALKALGYSHKVERLEDYTVVHQIEPSQKNLEPIDLDLISASASHKKEVARFAIDGDLKTRWGSGAPQNSEMRYSIKFSKPTKMRAVKLNFANWPHDYPRALRVVLKLGSSRKVTILSPGRYKAIRSFAEDDQEFVLYFEPQRVRKVIFQQLGTDPVFDWSIGEVSLYK